MPKYDGLSGKFENGVLSSRGDGIYGQDYTDRLPLIKWLVKSKKKSLLGEMLITNDDFKNFKNVKSKSGIEFKNQRNAAAGIIGCDDVKFYLDQNVKLTFIDYDYISYELSYQNFNRANWEDVIEKIQKLPYPMDGIVIKLKDENYFNELGFTEHSPRGSIAFKYSNPCNWTKLIGVTWTMGKEQLACVGQVEPIEINGSTIRNVKLQITKPLSNDVPYILNNSIGIMDKVLIERAGDIIPHVVKALPGVDRIQISIPDCPFCKSKLKVNSSSVICENPNCPEKLIQQLYFSMITLGFKNVGEVYARTLFEKLNIRDVYDLMTVEKEQLKLDKSFGNKMVDIFMNEQEAAKKVSFTKFLTAMKIPKLGSNVAKLLEKNYSKEDILNANFSYEKLISINGIGPIVARSIIENINSVHLKKCASLFEFSNEEDVNNENQIEICFTGKMEYSRSEMENIARKNNMIPVSSVGKNTKILVCADPNSNSSKMKNARKLGCKIISDKEFLKNFN